jgi:hypothetical protein
LLDDAAMASATNFGGAHQETPPVADFTIATMPARIASGRSGHASTTKLSPSEFMYVHQRMSQAKANVAEKTPCMEGHLLSVNPEFATIKREKILTRS